MATIYLIRHAHSKANEMHIWGKDLPLSDLGIEQAKKLGQENLQIDKLICSEKIRSQETAKYAFPDMKYEIDKEFDEINFGIYEDKTYERKSPNDMDYISECFYKDIKNFHKITQGDDATIRAISVIKRLKEIAQKYPNQKVGIISSHAIIVCAIAYILKGDINYKGYMKLPNCDYIKLEIENNNINVEEKIIDQLKDADKPQIVH